MAHPKNPSPGRVHHPNPQPPKTPGTPGTGQVPQTDTGVSPEDLNLPQVADFLLGSLPDHVVEVNGHFQAAPPPDQPFPKPPDVQTREQAVTGVTGRLQDGFLKTPHTLPEVLDEVVGLTFLLNAINTEALRVDLPFNSGQVRAGGYSLLKTALGGSEDSKSMKVDTEELGRNLAQSERIRLLREVFDVAYAVLDANETIVLGQTAKIVGDALDRGWSVIRRNGDLLRLLAPALAIRGEPVQQGLATRAQNQRRDEATVAEVQAKLQAQGPSEPAAGQPPGSNQASAPSSLATPKAHPGPGNKSGK